MGLSSVRKFLRILSISFPDHDVYIDYVVGERLNPRLSDCHRLILKGHSVCDTCKFRRGNGISTVTVMVLQTISRQKYVNELAVQGVLDFFGMAEADCF